MDARLCQYDVTPAQTHVMLYLHSHGGTAAQSEITLFLRVRPSTSNGILDRLQEKGLITRSISETDARQRILALTDSGREQVEKFRTCFSEAEAVIRQGLSAAELAQFRELLNRIIRNLEEDRTKC
jgi:DNA-binding MarR family transcriptional regulator